MGLKEAYQQKMEAQLKEWSAKIDLLKAKADKAEAGAKVEYYKQIDELRVKAEAAQTKLQQVKEAGEEAWETFKDGAEKAWAELKKAVESASAKFT